MITKEEAYSKISELVDRFGEQFSSYKKADYNEALTRRDFIDPFFKALGWDIDNSQGYSEANREVIHEDKLKVGTATKAPDYSFRLPGGKRQFFLEAKKPSVVVKDETAPAYQVRRYGWSAKLPISLITDFEEFAVYDCTKRPFDTDKASTARIKYLTYKSYLNEFDFIWNTFSKINVLKGGLEKYIQSDTHKKGTATVDKEFLSSLDGWRIQLALNIALRNRELSEDELNFIVQQTIDRIIFLRIAEDRKVEPYSQLQNLLKSGKEEGAFYKQLYIVFKEADSKYNSGLFDFRKDKLSANITVDNKVIKTIINELYYPVCPYEFSVLGVEILGSAYEQFLGKQIKLDKNHRVVIEEKPEVRKAGGVYYTPQYIVEYIVEQTVGKLAEGKTPEDVSKLKIVDPACGSGSFLLGAYEYLLKWHWRYYTPDFIKLSEIATNSNVILKQREAAIRQRNRLPLTPEGYLTTGLKKQILLNNIYGVDLDTQAVEVTKLSLLLKCMEGETASSINAEMRFGERVLPTLDDNIKSGNSLIDLDFYDAQIDFGEEKKIKPFNWQQAFPQVFTPIKNAGTKISSGFDAVIGNPPYGALFIDEELNYFKQRFTTTVGRGESYQLFIERAIILLKLNGLLGYIIPDTILNLGFTQSLRSYILMNSVIKEVVCLPSNVFSGVSVDTILLFNEKRATVKEFHESKISIQIFNKKSSLIKIDNPHKSFYGTATKWFSEKAFNIQADENDHLLLQKIENDKILIADVASMYSGIKAYEVGKGIPPQTEIVRDSKPYTANTRKSVDWKPFYDGKHIGSYQLLWNNNNYIIYGKWLAAPREASNFTGEKILIRKIIGKTLICTYVEDTSYCNTLLFVLKLKSEDYSYKSLLAILNSRLIGWYFRNKFQISDDDTFPQIMIRDILQFPIPKIKASIDKELKLLVDAMLNHNKQKQTAALAEKTEQLNQRLAYTDDKINKLVYELYGLTGEEIGVVEGGY